MSTSLDKIRASVLDDMQQALAEGLLVSPETCHDHDGQHPDSHRDLDTPVSFATGLLEAWTVDSDCSDSDKERIEALIYETLAEHLPKDLLGHL